jgi:polo-like kinase 1
MYIYIYISPKKAKDLITKILNSDPAKRPSIDEILSHEFFNQGGSIPKLLPVSTLACPPSASYLRQFAPSTSHSGSSHNLNKELSVGRSSPKRMENTAPNPHKQYLKVDIIESL